MKTLKEYVEKRLSSELEIIQRKRSRKPLQELNIYEETLIYYYTIDGYEKLNEDLREGKENSYEIFLNAALDKLSDYVGIVYRGIELTKNQIESLKIAEIENKEITEQAFVSSSKSLLIAKQYSRANTEVSIISKTGKEIEKYSFYGVDNPQNEQEVLFKSKTKFSVLGVDESEDITKIVLEEI